MKTPAPIVTPASLRARFAQMVSPAELERTEEDFRKARPKRGGLKDAGSFALDFWQKAVDRIARKQLPLSPPGTFHPKKRKRGSASSNVNAVDNPPAETSTASNGVPPAPRAAPAERKPQRNRHIKVTCTFIEGNKRTGKPRACGFHVRMSRAMLRVYGAPLCPCHPTRPMDPEAST